MALFEEFCKKIKKENIDAQTQQYDKIQPIP